MSHRPDAGSEPTTCSAFSARLDEPLPGTAPVAATWLAIEQPGPWGARALRQSHLDPEVGAQLERRAEGTGLRIALIRRVGRHALATADAPRTALLCDTRPGSAAVRSIRFTDPRELLELDLAALAAGRLDAGEPVTNPVLLVCTNGKRDRCCAQFGRALALELAQADPAADVWESDHLGGHRFAPTAVVLPTGYVYGRLDTGTALAALEAARQGRVLTERSRGRSTWSRPAQCAELALRAELQEFDADAIRVVGEQRAGDSSHAVELVARDARYRALVDGAPAARPRPESCGKAFGTPLELRVTEMEKLP